MVGPCQPRPSPPTDGTPPAGRGGPRAERSRSARRPWRQGHGRTTAKQELALAAALAILAGRWRYHPEKEHVALACKAYGAGMKQVRDYLKHLQLLHGPAAAAGGAWRPYEDCLQQLDRFMAWRASQGHPERGEPFHQLPNAPLRHAHSSRDALRSVSRRCPGQLVLVRRHCQRGRRWENCALRAPHACGVAGCARPRSADRQRHAVCRRGRAAGMRPGEICRVVSALARVHEQARLVGWCGASAVCCARCLWLEVDHRPPKLGRR